MTRSDRAGTNVDDQSHLKSRRVLVELYRPLAEGLASRFLGRGEPLEDLVQVAMVGLLKAIERFDPQRGTSLASYATATILGELKHHFRDNGWAIRVPRRLQEARLAVHRAVDQLAQEVGRSPSVSEIAERSGLLPEEVVEALSLDSVYSPQPLEETDELTRVPSAQTETLEILDEWASVIPHIRQLPERDRRMIYLRFFEGLTQTEVAFRLGVSQVHVCRLLSRALGEIRASVSG